MTSICYLSQYDIRFQDWVGVEHKNVYLQCSLFDNIILVNSLLLEVSLNADLTNKQVRKVKLVKRKQFSRHSYTFLLRTHGFSYIYSTFKNNSAVQKRSPPASENS